MIQGTRQRVLPGLYADLCIRYLQHQRGKVILLAFLLLGGIGLKVLTPQLLRRYLDAAHVGGSVPLLTTIALVFIGLTLLRQVVTLLTTYVGEIVGWSTTNMLRTELFQHCLRLDMPFYKDRTPGEMIERVDGDVTAVAMFFSQFVIGFFGNVLLLTGVLGVMYYEDWRLGLALSAFALLAVLVLHAVYNMAIPHWIAARQKSAELYGFIGGQVAGTEDIIPSGAAAHVLRRFYGFLRALLGTERKAYVPGRSMWPASLALFAIAYVVVISVGSRLLESGALTLGALYLVFYYTETLREPIEMITYQMQDFQKAGASIHRIHELWSYRSTIEDGTASLPAGPLSVAFEHVSFSYGDAGAVLHDLSFKLEAGRILGLLGRTGSGKTTITRLLFRLYDPTIGTVRLGGADLRTLRLSSLREQIAIVTQEVRLFRATVRDNLTLFRRHSMPDEEIVRVLEELGLRRWVRSLPEGLDTEIDSGGSGLSAGEAQLLALARVFLRNPELIILDEASSRLDPATECLSEQAIAQLLHGRTAIIIAHRLATVQKADEVMILENGWIREHGGRECLAADSSSRFSQLLHTGLEEEQG